jgi:hypothetical protein
MEQQSKNATDSTDCTDFAESHQPLRYLHFLFNFGIQDNAGWMLMSAIFVGAPKAYF